MRSNNFFWVRERVLTGILRDIYRGPTGGHPVNFGSVRVPNIAGYKLSVKFGILSETSVRAVFGNKYITN